MVCNVPPSARTTAPLVRLASGLARSVIRFATSAGEARRCSSDPAVGVSQHIDGRRQAGAQTRRRLLDAATEILASHGEPRLTLRAGSAVVGSNVATVKYHFGSRDGLVDEVITRATQSIVEAQLAALAALGEEGPPPSVAELIGAWATPLVRVTVSREASDRRLGRIIGQAQASPSLDGRFKDATAAPTQQLRDGLRETLPHMEAAELTLRVALAVSALVGFASGTPRLRPSHDDRPSPGSPGTPTHHRCCSPAAQAAAAWSGARASMPIASATSS